LPAHHFYTLSQQPPGTGNLAFWIDHKTNKNFRFYDLVWYRTLAMLEDMTGNGNGFNQTNKVQQPRLTATGGAFFVSGTFLPCVGGDMLASAGQVTLGFAFSLSSSSTCPIRISPHSISLRSSPPAAPAPARASCR
jgi:hypothetical protein